MTCSDTDTHTHSNTHFMLCHFNDDSKMKLKQKNSYSHIFYIHYFFFHFASSSKLLFHFEFCGWSVIAVDFEIFYTVLSLLGDIKYKTFTSCATSKKKFNVLVKMNPFYTFKQKTFFVNEIWQEKNNRVNLDQK